MADDLIILDSDETDNSPSKKNLVIYISPERIPKVQLTIMKQAAKRKSFGLTDKLGENVTHIVTAFDCQTQLSRIIDKAEVAVSEDVNIVKTNWFFESMKQEQPVEIREEHRPLSTLKRKRKRRSSKTKEFPDYECQRETPLEHHNTLFTDALDTLAEYAALKKEESKARAFTVGSCALKSLPCAVTHMGDIKRLKGLGSHCQEVIKDILNYGASQEVQKILSDTWFHKMKNFTKIFGVGPTIANKWIQEGHTNIDDVRKLMKISGKSRLRYGIEYYEDLVLTRVSRSEADHIRDMVFNIATSILPGVTVTITGGFRRGKKTGHDVDLLISHPETGSEIGLLEQIVKALSAQQSVIYGHIEQNTYSSKILTSGTKSNLDHFEKWLGIIKIDRKIRSQGETVDEGGPVEKRTKSCDATNDSGIINSSNDCDTIARRVDLIIAPASQYYFALVGWTGSKHFNRSLRLYAQREHKMTLTSHGLFDNVENKAVNAQSEEDVFKNLKIKYLKPECRNC